MQLNEMIFSRLVESQPLAGLLAQYDGRSAVFYSHAAPANSAQWGDVQYPRIDYTLDFQHDPARETGARLIVNIWCDAHFGAQPEAVESALRQLFHASFAFASDGAFALSWLRSDTFELPASDAQFARTLGITMHIDLAACECLALHSPDPVRGIGAWTKRTLPKAVVVGFDEMDGWYVPLPDAPVIVWRLSSTALAQRRNVFSWLEVVLEGQVYAAGAQARLTALSTLHTALSHVHHVELDDQSPLLITDCAVKPHARLFAPGQLTVKGRFGALAPGYEGAVEAAAVGGGEEDTGVFRPRAGS